MFSTVEKGFEKTKPEESDALEGTCSKSTLTSKQSQCNTSSTSRCASLIGLAQICRLHCHWPEAKSAAREAIDCCPSDPTVRNLLIDLLLERGEFDEVISESKKWLKHEPGSIGALEALVKGYWQKVDFKSGIRTLSRLLDLCPIDLYHRFRRGMLFQYIGNWADAMEDYRQVIRMAGDDPIAASADQALASLDKWQLRRITQMLFESPSFREHFKSNREEAIATHGFSLSEDGWRVIQWMQSDWESAEVASDFEYARFS
ncbi:MAG: hypothetical protein WCO51_09270 [bacterium]